MKWLYISYIKKTLFINIMKKKLNIIILILITTNIFSQQNLNCYTVIVGKSASFDGSVLIGHNEDDGGEMLVNWFKVPAKEHNEKDSFILLNGAKIKQVELTNSYIRFQVTKQKFGDAYLNEHSVVICSDACQSKEDTAKGIVGYNFRRLIAERATSARDAVKIGGKLVEELGYESSGRTYTIADKNEAWMLSIVKGKRWIAQRVPNNHVAIIPNYYTIQEVDLEDTVNYLSSADIIDYAVKRGWYDVKDVFNFRKVYGDSACNIADYNIPRHVMGINLFTKDNLINSKLSFSFIPDKKVNLEDLKLVLSNHYEGTEYCNLPDNGNPHRNKVRTICVKSTQFSFIAQLRNNMPNTIGSLVWISPFNGCIFPYIPLYFGIENTNKNVRIDYSEANKIHFEENYNNLDLYPKHAYSSFNKYVNYIEKDYYKRIKKSSNFKMKIENILIKNQRQFEELVLKVYKNNPIDTKKILTDYCNMYFENVLKFSENNVLE